MYFMFFLKKTGNNTKSVLEAEEIVTLEGWRCCKIV